MSIRLTTATVDQTVRWPEAGLSEESKDIKSRLEEIQRDQRKPISFSWRDSLQDELEDIVESCKNTGWDGYDAEPISTESASGALQLIEALPEHIRPPNVIPEPGGEIALEWRTDDQRHFSVSVSGATLVYAGVFGGSCKKYGEERFFDVLPPAILGILTRYFSEA